MGGSHQKVKRGRGRQGADLSGAAIEKPQTLEAWLVQLIVDTFCEVRFHIFFGKLKPRRPLARDVIQAGGLKAVVSRALKDLGQRIFRARRVQRLLPNRPECEDEGLAGMANPLFGEIERN